jgi:two-component system nitrogen regulation sensor histidine kinase NtrY
LKNSPQAESVLECTKAIVEHVEIIKRLANEFSEYGRMPTARFVSTDIVALAQSSVSLFKGEHPAVAFTFDCPERLPEMLLDPEQIRGVIINVLNNAVAAVPAQSGRVEVKISFDRKARRAVLEVSDNGSGIPAADKNRIFEPYFTTKRGGTGLGLAIVSSVVSDHQGEVRVFDNHPCGSRFVISLPQQPQPGTARRLSSV